MAVSSIHNFAVTHNMKLNPGKCKEMVINFMKNPNFLLGPIVVGSTMIQRVKFYKLLGVFIDDDLKWSTHVDYIYRKACKRLYSLRLLGRAGISTTGMLKILVLFDPFWSTQYRCGSLFAKCNLKSWNRLKSNFSHCRNI